MQGIAPNELELSDGAHARIRTGDLLLTKEMLYRLSYVGAAPKVTRASKPSIRACRAPDLLRTDGVTEVPMDMLPGGA
jgi:hypothetical protein